MKMIPTSTLYLVSDGDYSDYRVLGVFSTPEKASEAVKFYAADNEIAPIELDALPEAPYGLFRYTVLMAKDGTAGETYRISNTNEIYHENGQPSYFYKNSLKFPCMSFDMWAKDETHAVKIANEKRVQLIATGEWEDNWDNWIKKLRAQEKLRETPQS